MLNRIHSCLAAAVLFAATTAVEAFPDKTVTMIVPFPAGASTDISARDFAQELSAVFKQTVVVDNRTGAEGLIGAQALLNGPTDGHMLLFTSSSLTVLDPVMRKTMPYDPARDFTPICSVAQINLYLFATGSGPYKSAADVVAAAKAQPGKLTFAYTSASTRLGAELFAQSAGIKMTGIPYRSGPGALTDVSTGQVDFMVIDQITATPFLQSGKLKTLAAATNQRSKDVPDVPTGAEVGLPGFTMAPWQGVYVSAKTPAALVEQLRAQVLQAVKSPGAAANFAKRGLTEFALCGDALAKFQREDLEKARGVVKAAGIEPQ
jgi:tripartite-type tricarboxylate transporter receptor subunit TctC